MKRAIILCMFFIIVGCGRWAAVHTIPVIQRDAQPIVRIVPAASPTEAAVFSKKQYEKNYEIGEIKHAFIGQEIVKVRPYKTITTTKTTKMKKKTISCYDEKTASSHDPLQIAARYRLRNHVIKSEVGKNYAITKSIKIEGHIYDMISLLDNYGFKWGVLIDNKGEVFKSGLYSYNYNMMYYPDDISIETARFNISWIKMAEPDFEIGSGVEFDAEIESWMEAEPKVEISHHYDNSYTPFELIYSGRNNVSLNVIYREYTPTDMARSAFFQNLTYQADAKIIRYKDFVIKVHSASNEKITYTVVEDGLK